MRLAALSICPVPSRASPSRHCSCWASVPIGSTLADVLAAPAGSEDVRQIRMMIAGAMVGRASLRTTQRERQTGLGCAATDHHPFDEPLGPDR